MQMMKFRGLLLFSLLSLVAVVWPDLTTITVHPGDVVCARTRVNAREQAGLSGKIVKTLSESECGTFYGGIVTKDGYQWYRVYIGGQIPYEKLSHRKVAEATTLLKDNLTKALDLFYSSLAKPLAVGYLPALSTPSEVAWVAGKYLTPFSDVYGRGRCSKSQQSKACLVLAKHKKGTIWLATRHPSGVSDNAYAYNNIRDMCNGFQASRSKYSCSECRSGTPGGHVCLGDKLLDYLLKLASGGHVVVNELAGACHSCNSRHYKGQAVDLHNDRRTAEYLRECKSMGGRALDEGNHVHCTLKD